MMKDLRWARQQRPTLNVGVARDGASELWNRIRAALFDEFEFKGRRCRFRYASLNALGLHKGSDVTEGACKSLIDTDPLRFNYCPNCASLNAMSKRRRPAQLSAGARRGPKPGSRPLVRHRAREASSPSHPLHVVIRSKFRSLRSQFVFPTVRKALADATRAREDFRITHYSVQGDHLHLLVEANSKQALSRGMQGLAIRIARRVNRLISRSGKLWADRFFSRALTSPRSMRNALAYVLNNFRKHRAPDGTQIDPYSSAPYFAGFRELRGKPPWELPHSRRMPISPPGVPVPAFDDEMPILEARTWLGQLGWRKAGLIALAEAPSAPH